MLLKRYVVKIKWNWVEGHCFYKGDWETAALRLYLWDKTQDLGGPAAPSLQWIPYSQAKRESLGVLCHSWSVTPSCPPLSSSDSWWTIWFSIDCQEEERERGYNRSGFPFFFLTLSMYHFYSFFKILLFIYLAAQVFVVLQELSSSWWAGLVTLKHVRSSQTRDWTSVRCIARQILNQ